MHRRLGDLLLDGGFVSKQVLDAALAESQRSQRPLGQILIRSGHLPPDACRAIKRLQDITVDMDTALHLAIDSNDKLDDQLYRSGQITRKQYDRLHSDLSRSQAKLAKKNKPRSRFNLARLLMRDTRLDRDRIRACLDAPTEHDAQARARAGIRLGDLLLASGDINLKQLQAALAEQRRTGQPLGKVLLSHGWLAPARMRRAIHLQRKLATAAFGAAMAFSHSAYADTTDTKSDNVMVASLGAGDTGTTDARFASLTDLHEQIQQHKQRRLTIKERNEKLRAEKTRLKQEQQARKTARAVAKGNTQLSPDKVRPWVQKYAKQQGLPVDLIMAVIHTESKFKTDARSRANAIGLMQLIPKSGGRAAYTYLRGVKTTPSNAELKNPETNIKLGAAYLRLISDRYFKTVENRELKDAMVLAAYNWGPTRVKNLINSQGMPANAQEFGRILRQHAPRETRRYVEIVSQRRAKYSAKTHGQLVASQ